MKKLLVLLLLIFTCTIIYAQHIISVNGKQVLRVKGKEDNADKKIKLKSNNNYKAGAALEIKDIKSSKNWIRYYIIYDEQDNLIMGFDNNKESNLKLVFIKLLLLRLETGEKDFALRFGVEIVPCLSLWILYVCLSKLYV